MLGYGKPKTGAQGSPWPFLLQFANKLPGTLASQVQADLVEPETIDDPRLTDVNDQPVLGTLSTALRAGQADVLVIGDKALLALSDRYPVRTAAEFWAAHGSL